MQPLRKDQESGIALLGRVEGFMPGLRPQVGRFQSQVMLFDEAFLRMLTEVRIRHSGTVEEARMLYEAAADPAGPWTADDVA